MCVKMLVKLCFYTDPLKFATVNKNLAGRPKKFLANYARFSWRTF